MVLQEEPTNFIQKIHLLKNENIPGKISLNQAPHTYISAEQEKKR
jgi:hypothetical protein